MSSASKFRLLSNLFTSRHLSEIREMRQKKIAFGCLAANEVCSESVRSLRRYVARVAELNGILERAKLENFTITNENRPLTEVAQELLVKAGWISAWQDGAH